MKKIKYIFKEYEKDVVLKVFPDDFKRQKFLGLQTKDGERYFRSNWYISENKFFFWYPFVGGRELSVWVVIRTEKDLKRLLKSGCTFWAFDDVGEVYEWMANQC